jgi:sucrose-6-phosphate hydrolase SacC (GH32 family)
MRPEFHFTPSKNWMNDPNGLIYNNGLYHLYFQYNPFGIDWGHMSWGHATSTDLVTWKQQDVAIPESNGKMIFSGSAVFDKNNTSGLGTTENPPLIAIYTAHDETLQTQCIAYSLDNGFTFTQYEANPVLDLSLKDFRDPKVFWYDTDSCWIMVVVDAHEKKVLLYRSTNLIDWQPLSTFGPIGSVDGIWECPDLFPLHIDNEIKWVLIVSVNPGGPVGGSGIQYFIGDFDGVTFIQTEHVGVVKWLDHGPDYYAAVSYNDAPSNKRIMIGWMSNSLYANKIPANEYRGTMSAPRELRLERINGEIELIQKPIEALLNKCIDIEITSEVSTFEQGVQIQYSPEKQSILVKRGNVSFGDEEYAISYTAEKLPISAQLLLDQGTCELFINKGEIVFTQLLA